MEAQDERYPYPSRQVPHHQAQASEARQDGEVDVMGTKKGQRRKTARRAYEKSPVLLNSSLANLKVNMDKVAKGTSFQRRKK